MIQVGTETACFDFLTQITIGRREDARPAEALLSLSDPVESAIFEDTE